MNYWYGKIMEATSSGMEIGVWCEKNGISRSRYYYWHGILSRLGRISKKDQHRNAALALSKKGSVPGGKQEVPTIVEINTAVLRSSQRADEIGSVMGASEVKTAKIILQTDSCLIHVGCGFDAETLRRVMEVVG